MGLTNDEKRLVRLAIFHADYDLWKEYESDGWNELYDSIGEKLHNL